MEYRAQTYLGALQLLAVSGGVLLLRMAVKIMGEGEVVVLDGRTYDPLGFARPLNDHGWVLLVVPLLWIVLTIRGEQSDRRWASKRMTFVSGMVLLIGLMCLFGAAGLMTMRMVF